MSLPVHCILHASNHKNVRVDAFPYTTYTFYGFSPVIYILPEVISNLILKLGQSEVSMKETQLGVVTLLSTAIKFDYNLQVGCIVD